MKELLRQLSWTLLALCRFFGGHVFLHGWSDVVVVLGVDAISDAEALVQW